MYFENWIQCLCINVFTLTRAPLALQIFHHLLGGGGGEHPRLFRLLLVVEKNGKNVRKIVKNDYKTI